MKVNIDFFAANGSGGVQASGEMASRVLQENINVGEMRPFIHEDGRTYITIHKGYGSTQDPKNYMTVPINNAGTLRRDEWKLIDDAVLRVAEERLRGVMDLKNKGLVKDIGNGMDSSVFEYEDISSALEASLSMDGNPRGDNDRQVYTSNYIPLPFVHVDYKINERFLRSSRKKGTPIDTSLAERASRAVAVKLEEMLFTDTDYSYGGGTIYSYINAPNRNTVTLSTNWNASGKTGPQIVDDILSMKQASINADHYGPWMVYIPTEYETVLDEDYDDTSGSQGTTIRERIMKIDGISGIMVIDKLPANNVLMVEMNTETVRWLMGMGIQNVQWSTNGGFTNNFKVMTIQVPQIRADQNGKSGIVHLSS